MYISPPNLTPFQNCRKNILRLRRYDRPLPVPQFHNFGLITTDIVTGQDRDGEVRGKDCADHVLSGETHNSIGDPGPAA